MLHQWGVTNFVFLFIPLVVDSACTVPRVCQNRYVETDREKIFYRIFWNLTEVPSNIPHQAEWIYLNNNFITSLSENVFRYLAQCTKLWLSDNHINTIESGAFKGLNSLEKLNLDYNKLIHLSNGSFVGLTKLTELSLTNNQISTIEPGSFNGLNSRLLLILETNNMTQLTANMFSGLTNLTKLYLGYNHINTIERGAFNGLESLKTLSMHHNNVTHLTTNVFFGLINLNQLYLWFNEINTVDPGAFNGLNSLTKLWLLNNELAHLSTDMFSGLKITDLRLSNNQISSIKPETFHGLGYQEMLFLFGNNLTSLSAESFLNLPRPLTLALSNPYSADDLPWNCSSLCWLKQEVHDKTVTWFNDGELYKLECADGVDWDSLQCDLQGDCPNPGGIPFALRTGSTGPYTQGSEVTYVCNECYFGGGTTTCRTNGTWTRKPTCSFLQGNCSDPGMINNGQKFLSDDMLQCGSTITYTCNAGYILQGQSVVTCGPQGTFDHPTPVCSACPEPESVDHATRSGAVMPYKLHDHILFTCAPCFTGGGSITCLSSKEWSANHVCSEISCPDPLNIDNGVKDPPTGPHRCGEAVTYICDNGYRMKGNAVLRCQENGEFNQAPPLCIDPDLETTTSATTAKKSSNQTPTSTTPPNNQGNGTVKSTASQQTDNHIHLISVTIASVSALVLAVVALFTALCVRRTRHGGGGDTIHINNLNIVPPPEADDNQRNAQLSQQISAHQSDRANTSNQPPPYFPPSIPLGLLDTSSTGTGTSASPTYQSGVTHEEARSSSSSGSAAPLGDGDVVHYMSHDATHGQP